MPGTYSGFRVDLPDLTQTVGIEDDAGYCWRGQQSPTGYVMLPVS